MPTHSSILAWRIPWTEEPGRLQSMGSQSVGHNWMTNTQPPLLLDMVKWLCFSLFHISRNSVLYFCQWIYKKGCVSLPFSVLPTGMWSLGSHPRSWSKKPCIQDIREQNRASSQAWTASLNLDFASVRENEFIAAAAKSFQSSPTLCDPRDGSPPGSPVPGILQARILEWIAISFSNAWKWKVKAKSLSRVPVLATPWTAAFQAPPSMGFSRQEYWSGVPLPSPEFIASKPLF